MREQLAPKHHSCIANAGVATWTDEDAKKGSNIATIGIFIDGGDELNSNDGTIA